MLNGGIKAATKALNISQFSPRHFRNNKAFYLDYLIDIKTVDKVELLVAEIKESFLNAGEDIGSDINPYSKKKFET